MENNSKFYKEFNEKRENPGRMIKIKYVYSYTYGLDVVSVNDKIKCKIDSHNTVEVKLEDDSIIIFPTIGDYINFTLNPEFVISRRVKVKNTDDYYCELNILIDNFINTRLDHDDLPEDCVYRNQKITEIEKYNDEVYRLIS